MHVNSDLYAFILSIVCIQKRTSLRRGETSTKHLEKHMFANEEKNNPLPMYNNV